MDDDDEGSSESHRKESRSVSLKNTEKGEDKDKAEEDKNASEPEVYCEAFPVDKARYQQQTGQSVVDISKVVICLNYSDYMYLEELFQRFQLCAEQKSVMEQRFAELLVALGPELCSQLVVDLKACPNLEVDPSPESMQEDV